MCVVPPPEIISHPVDIRADNGSTVVFNCTLFSYDVNITYTWLKNGDALSSESDGVNFINSNVVEDNNDTYTTTLVILDVQLSDNGIYVCSATNREGSISSNGATLSVIGKL